MRPKANKKWIKGKKESRPNNNYAQSIKAKESTKMCGEDI